MTIKKSILIIDEEISSRTLLSIMLEAGSRFQTLKAKDAESALGLLKKTRPDLIVVDIDTHVMDGIEFCRILRTRPDTNAIPILMLSSKADADSVMRGLQAGANDYLTKPILHHSLVDKVQAILTTNPART